MSEFRSENTKTVVEATFIKAFWAVFGYSFVGFISLIYGLILQVYNYGKDVFIALFVENFYFRQFYIIMIVLIVLYNLLFCHAYASLYLRETDTDRYLYHKLGHWLETILLIIVLAYFIPTLFTYDEILFPTLSMVIISVPWFICIVFYRSFLVYQKNEGGKLHERIKYRLVIPSILLIATNIYTGSCIEELWNGEIVYFITFFLLLAFVISYCFIDYVGYKKRKKGNNIKSLFERKIPYIYYAVVLSITGLAIYAAHYLNVDYFNIPTRSLFLASFVAVYLGMFEGWFLLRNKNHASNKTIRKWVTFVLKFMPIVVFVLFPFQDFQLIYYVLFIIGHLVTWIYWNHYNDQIDKHPKEIAVLRGILGTVTLLSLILDKWFPLNVEYYLGKIINTNSITKMYNTFALIELGISFLSLLIQDFKVKVQQGNIEKIASVLGYFVTIIILSCYHIFIGIKELRILLSAIGCLPFIIFEFVLNFDNKRKGKN